jgi:hypothetical protein
VPLAEQEGGGHRAGMAAALPALHGHRIGTHFHGFHRVFEGANRGHADHPGVLQAGDHRLARRAAVAHRAHLVAQDQFDDLAGIGLVHVEIDAERPVGQPLGFEDGGFHPLGFDGGAGEEAEAACITGGGYQFRVGHPAHGGLDYRVAAAEQPGQAGIEGDRHHASAELRCDSAMPRAS